MRRRSSTARISGVGDERDDIEGLGARLAPANCEETEARKFAIVVQYGNRSRGHADISVCAPRRRVRPEGLTLSFFPVTFMRSGRGQLRSAPGGGAPRRSALPPRRSGRPAAPAAPA